MSEHKPMTDEDLAEVKKRLDAITSEALTNVPWKAYSVGKTKSGFEYFGIEGVVDAGLLYDRDYGYENCLGIDGEMKATFIAAAPTDIARLLAEVERLREEKEILEGTLDRLGIFVQENLNYCAADFIGEGIDEDAEFTCKTEYDPDNGCQKCYSNCWAEVFRKTAEEEINALKELEKENAE